MDVKRDILWRIYLCFIGLILLCVAIVAKAFYIQQVQGQGFKKMSDSLYIIRREIAPNRGAIYSADGQTLKTDIPKFDIYIDFRTENLRAIFNDSSAKHELFNSLKPSIRLYLQKKIYSPYILFVIKNDKLDLLCMSLANFFKDKSADAYREELLNAYQDCNRWDLLVKNLDNSFKGKTPDSSLQNTRLSYLKKLHKYYYYPFKKDLEYRQYQALQQLPLVREGRDKSGFITDIRNIRVYPYDMLAHSTVGIHKDLLNTGLEAAYDTTLRGTPGERWVRLIPGGEVPIDEDSSKLQSGKDVVSTIDTYMQEIAENALMKMMVSNQAQQGCAIVMETKTGQIKAIANLGKQGDGYAENNNYALQPTEPGSVFKLATMLSLLEDGKVTLNQPVNLDGGKWLVNGKTVYDAEPNENANTALQAFEVSSNVGMAKLTYGAYKDNPAQFVNHIIKLGLGDYTGVDIGGEERHWRPVVHATGSKYWSATSLPWMAFGYGVMISPLSIAMLYNSIANNGAMLKPYLVSDIKEGNITVKHFNPVVTRIVADSQVVKLLQQCLYGVCNDPHGTGYKVMKNLPFKVCGKTGTALVANGARGYADKIYQAAFAGYFPADNPQYTCVVVIINKPHAALYYGAQVAAPVFREIAARLYALYVRDTGQNQRAALDSLKSVKSVFNYTGNIKELKTFANGIGLKNSGQTSSNEQGTSFSNDNNTINATLMTDSDVNQMPNLTGMNLKDALYLCENLGLKVNVSGVGRVLQQSLAGGVPIAKGQLIHLDLSN